MGGDILSHGMIVKKNGKYYALSRKILRALAFPQAEVLGTELDEAEVKNLKLAT